VTFVDADGELGLGTSSAPVFPDGPFAPERPLLPLGVQDMRVWLLASDAFARSEDWEIDVASDEMIVWSTPESAEPLEVVAGDGLLPWPIDLQACRTTDVFLLMELAIPANYTVATRADVGLVAMSLDMKTIRGRSVQVGPHLCQFAFFPPGPSLGSRRES
jgi:hypothetical protein